MEPKYFLPSEIARLVLGYLKQEDCMVTYKSFLKECPHLSEYASLLKQGMEYPTTVTGKSLVDMLQGYAHLKITDTKAVQASEPTSTLWKQFDTVVRTIKHQVSNKQIRPTIGIPSRRGRPRKLCADVTPIAPKPISVQNTIVMSPTICMTQMPPRTTQHSSGTSQHLSGTTQHSTGTTQHLSGTTQHSSGTTQHLSALTNPRQDYNANEANQGSPSVYVPIQSMNQSTSVPKSTENCNLLSDGPRNNETCSGNGEDSNSNGQTQDTSPDDLNVQSSEYNANHSDHNQNVMVVGKTVTLTSTPGEEVRTDITEEPLSAYEDLQTESYTASSVLVDICNTTENVCESAAEHRCNDPQPMDSISGPDRDHSDCEMDNVGIDSEATRPPVMTSGEEKASDIAMSKSPMPSTSWSKSRSTVHSDGDDANAVFDRSEAPATQPKCSSPKGNNSSFLPVTASTDPNCTTPEVAGSAVQRTCDTYIGGSTADVLEPPATPSKQVMMTDPMTSLENLSFTETESNKGRSPRRKRFPPRKRPAGSLALSGVGKSGPTRAVLPAGVSQAGQSDSNSKDSSVFNINEDAMDMTEFFGQILKNQELHEKLAENINKQLHHEKSPVVKPAAKEKSEGSRLDASIQSLEDILDMHEPQMSENTMSGIINMTQTDPAFDALFKLFNVDKDEFIDEEYGKREKDKGRESLTTPPCQLVSVEDTIQTTTISICQPSTSGQCQSLEERVVRSALDGEKTAPGYHQSNSDSRTIQTTSVNSSVHLQMGNFSSVRSSAPPQSPVRSSCVMSSASSLSPVRSSSVMSSASSQSPVRSSSVMSSAPPQSLVWSSCVMSSAQTQSSYSSVPSEELPLNNSSAQTASEQISSASSCVQSIIISTNVQSGMSKDVSQCTVAQSKTSVEESNSNSEFTKTCCDSGGNGPSITECVIEEKSRKKTVCSKKRNKVAILQSSCPKSPATPDSPKLPSPLRRSPRNRVNKKPFEDCSSTGTTTAQMARPPEPGQQTVTLKTKPKKGRSSSAGPSAVELSAKSSSSKKSEPKSKKSSPGCKGKGQTDKKTVQLHVSSASPRPARGRSESKSSNISCVTATPEAPDHNTLTTTQDNEKTLTLVRDKITVWQSSASPTRGRPKSKSSKISRVTATPEAPGHNTVTTIQDNAKTLTLALRKLAPKSVLSQSKPPISESDQSSVEAVSQSDAPSIGLEARDSLPSLCSRDKKTGRGNHSSKSERRSSGEPSRKATRGRVCRRVTKERPATSTPICTSPARVPHPILRHPLLSSTCTPKAGGHHVSFVKPKPLESLHLPKNEASSATKDSHAEESTSRGHVTPRKPVSNPFPNWSPGLSALLKMVSPQKNNDECIIPSTAQPKCNTPSSMKAQASAEDITAIDKSVLEKSDSGELIISPLGKHGNITLSPHGKYVIVPPCLATSQQEQRVSLTSLVETAQKLYSSHTTPSSASVAQTVQSSGSITSPEKVTRVNVVTTESRQVIACNSTSMEATIQRLRTSTSSTAIVTTSPSSSSSAFKSCSGNPASARCNSSGKVEATKGKTASKNFVSPRRRANSNITERRSILEGNSPGGKLDTSYPYFFSPSASSCQSDDVTLSPASVVSPSPQPVSISSNEIIAIPIGRLDLNGKFHVRTLDFGEISTTPDVLKRKTQKKVKMGKVSRGGTHEPKHVVLENQMMKANQNSSRVVKKGRGRQCISSVNILAPEMTKTTPETRPIMPRFIVPAMSATPSITTRSLDGPMSAGSAGVPLMKGNCSNQQVTANRTSGLGTPILANPTTQTCSTMPVVNPLTVVNQRVNPLTVVNQHVNPLTVVNQPVDPLTVVNQPVNPLTVISPRSDSAPAAVSYILTLSGELLPATMSHAVASPAVHPISQGPINIARPIRMSPQSSGQASRNRPIAKVKKSRKSKPNFLKNETISLETKVKLKDSLGQNIGSEPSLGTAGDIGEMRGGADNSLTERRSVNTLRQTLMSHRPGMLGDGQPPLTTVDLSQLLDRPPDKKTDTVKNSGSQSSRSSDSKKIARKRPAPGMESSQKGTEAKTRKFQPSQNVDLSKLDVDKFLSSLYSK